MLKQKLSASHIFTILLIIAFLISSILMTFEDVYANTGNVVDLASVDETIDPSEYSQTKQVILVDDNLEETQKLEYFNVPETNEQNITDILAENIETQLIKENVCASSDLITSDIKDLKKESVEKEKLGNVLYSDLALDADDEFLLAVIIYCEAGNQSYEGKVAVGNVVLNRVASPRFPNTIREVIYAPGQFSPVGMGWYEKELAKGTVNESCLQAARDAMNGVDIVGDALFFHVAHEGEEGYILGAHVFY